MGEEGETGRMQTFRNALCYCVIGIIIAMGKNGKELCQVVKGRRRIAGDVGGVG